MYNFFVPYLNAHVQLPTPAGNTLYCSLQWRIKGALNPNFLNLTINGEKIWL